MSNQNTKLEIEGVDADLLEEQRRALGRVIELLAPRIPFGDLDHLIGIKNMLDWWSDERFHDEWKDES